MSRRNYIFTDKKHSTKGEMSVILGIISLLSMSIVVYLTYKSDTQASNGYGFTGLFATLFSITGLILGIVTAKEKDNFKIFPVLGIIINAVNLAFISLVLYFGTW